MKHIFFSGTYGGFSLFCALSLMSCGFSKSPTPDTPSRPSLSQAQAQSLILSEDCTACGTVVVPLQENSLNPRWVYWKAGASKTQEAPDANWVRSFAWDMRFTTIFPVVGTNGGATGKDEGCGFIETASVALYPTERAFPPQSVQDLQDLSFVTDQHSSLSYAGVSLPPRYQNPLINTIGETGMVREYSLKTHQVTLSQNIYILRIIKPDTYAYYAIVFREYASVPDQPKTLTFDWRKLD